MGLAGVEHHFAGAEDFTGLQDAATVRQSIGPNLAVAAPSEVDGGHRAGLLGEAAVPAISIGKRVAEVRPDRFSTTNVPHSHE